MSNVLPFKSPASSKPKTRGQRQGSKIQETYRIAEYFLKKHPEHEAQLDAFLTAYVFTTTPVKVSDIIDSVIQSLPENVFAICATRYRLTSRASNQLKSRVARGELLFEDGGKSGGSYRLNQDFGKAKVRRRPPALSTSPATQFVTRNEFQGLVQTVDKLADAVQTLAKKIG